MNVGELKTLLEWVDDKTEVYVPSSVHNLWERASASLEFVEESSHGERYRELCEPEAPIDNEVGLIFW